MLLGDEKKKVHQVGGLSRLRLGLGGADRRGFVWLGKVKLVVGQVGWVGFWVSLGPDS